MRKNIISFMLLILFFSIVTDVKSEQYLLDTNLAFNGTIRTIVNHGGINYIGGSFTKISKLTGFGTLVNKTDGDFYKNYPKVNGKINVVIPDGNDGWFLGGEFTKVGNTARLRLAQIDKNGILTNWAPNVNIGLYPYIYDMIKVNDKIFVCGSFTGINDTSRKYSACIDLNGNLTSWDPQADDEVFTISHNNGVIYLGGNFRYLKGEQRNFIGAVNFDANLLSWNPDANNSIKTIAIDNNKIYLGGNFTRINNVAANRLAAFYTNGIKADWNPSAAASVESISITGNRIYIGGRFTKVNNVSRSYLAALDTTGVLINWIPTSNGIVYKIMTDGTDVYTTGAFTSINNQPRYYFAAIDKDANLKNWNPDANSNGYAIAIKDTSIFIGGMFSGLKGFKRSFIAAVDTDGNVLTWNPVPNNEVGTIAINDTIVYFAGNFTTVNNSSRKYIAAVSIYGNLLGWDPQLNSPVYAIKPDGTNLVIGGSFTKVKSLNYKYLAIIDKDGNPTSFNPIINSSVYALDVLNSHIYFGGFFTSVNSTTRNRLASVDMDGNLDSWNPDADNVVLALNIFKSKIYVGGWFSSISSKLRSRLAALTPDGTLLDWAPSPNNSIWAIFGINEPFDVIYVGGDFTSISGYNYSNIAGVDLFGNIIPWDPNPDRSVYAISANKSAVFTGGVFYSMEETISPNYASISTYKPLPLTPSLISPEDLSTKLPLLQEFSWTPTEFTSGYRLLIAKDNLFNQIISNIVVPDNFYKFTDSTLQYSTNYYWKVRSVNSGGESDWSQTWSFSTQISPPLAVNLISPENNATDIDFAAKFIWKAIPDVLSYEIEISKDADFLNIVYNNHSIIDTTFTIQSNILEAKSVYFWKVRAKNEGGNGFWSGAWSFQTIENYTQEIVLNQGWNLISSYLIPKNISIEVIFNDIKSNITIVKDFAGNVYIPEYEINTIGNWNETSAYYVYSTISQTLTITGLKINPALKPISLVQGWNAIPYLRTAEMSVETALESLVSSGNLIMAKDNYGNVYIPEYDYNNIGNLKPGMGYLIYLINNDTLTYPSNE
jgi:hypothetical protein